MDFYAPLVKLVLEIVRSVNLISVSISAALTLAAAFISFDILLVSSDSGLAMVYLHIRPALMLHTQLLIGSELYNFNPIG